MLISNFTMRWGCTDKWNIDQRILTLLVKKSKENLRIQVWLSCNKKRLQEQTCPTSDSPQIQKLVMSCCPCQDFQPRFSTTTSRQVSHGQSVLSRECYLRTYWRQRQVLQHKLLSATIIFIRAITLMTLGFCSVKGSCMVYSIYCDFCVHQLL